MEEANAGWEREKGVGRCFRCCRVSESCFRERMKDHVLSLRDVTDVKIE